MSKERWSTGLKKGFIISLSVLLMLPFALYFGGNKVSANTTPFNKSTSYYTLSFSEDMPVSHPTDENVLLISWRPNTTYDFIEVVDVKCAASSTTYFQLRLVLYGTGNIVIPLQDLNTSPTSSNTTVSSVYSFQKGVSEQQYFNSVISSLNNIAQNGIYIRNYDVTLKQIPAIAYFVGNNGDLQSDNDFIGSSSLFLDYPIYKGYTLDPAINLFTDGDTDEYIFIIANNISYQIFANVTYTTLSGWSSVTTTGTGFKRYSDTLQVNYMKMKNNMDGSSYTRAQYYINFSNNAKNYLNNYQYIPIYYGKIKDCPEEFLDLAGLKPPDQQAGEETADNIDSTNDQFSNEISNIDDIQDDLEDDFQTNIQAIDTNLDFQTSFGQKFLTSAQWVRTQFETLTTQTPYGSILFFALTLGLALMIIGRVI